MFSASRILVLRESTYPAALEWMKRGLELAYIARDPVAVRVELLQIARLRRLDRLDPSREMLHEALELMVPIARYRRDLELDRALGLLLHHYRARGHLVAMADIPNLE